MSMRARILLALLFVALLSVATEQYYEQGYLPKIVDLLPGGEAPARSSLDGDWLPLGTTVNSALLAIEQRLVMPHFAKVLEHVA